MRRFVRRVGAIVLLIVVLCAVPVAGVELTCKAPVALRENYTPLVDAADRRAEGDSFLTYPEWSIVYAYADLAGVMRQSSESSFDYLAAVGNFWTSLCGATRTASATGSATLDQRMTNYIIGLSFSAEMLVKGFWERTIGALSVSSRGEQRTQEDAFALRVADDYAAFLQQTPWYEFPFWEKLERFWSDVPLRGDHIVRKIERRVALSLEWGGKSFYAAALRTLAGVAPAALTIRSVVKDVSPDDVAAIPQMTKIRDVDNGLTLIETPRYAAFTNILRALATRQKTVVEIAGNRRILTTVLVPAGVMLEAGGAREIFSLPMQSRPGWRRVGLDTDVGVLTAQITAVERQGAVFEHAYDY